MNGTSSHIRHIYLPIAVVLAAALAWIFLPRSTGFFVFMATLVAALIYSAYSLISRSDERKQKAAQLWRAVVDFFWGI